MYIEMSQHPEVIKSTLLEKIFLSYVSKTYQFLKFKFNPVVRNSISCFNSGSCCCVVLLTQALSLILTVLVLPGFKTLTMVATKAFS